MGQWTLHNTLLLLLLCRTDGQFDDLGRISWSDRPSWSDRFVSFGTYLDLQDPVSIEETINSAPRFTVLAPDLLRTDTEVNLYLQVTGLSSPLPVDITIQDFRRATMLFQESVTLNSENGFHALKSIKLPSDNLDREEKKNKFVSLKVNFRGYHIEERIMMVYFHSGYIFIQTDKPIYNPGDTVRFRTFVSSPSFKAFEGSITVHVENPKGVEVKQLLRIKPVEGIFSYIFPLSEFVNEGIWKVTAKFDHWQQNTFSSQFEVKKYVLPAFNVTLTPRKTFLNLEDEDLEVEISARYLFGQLVQGTAYVVFGVKINDEMRRLPSVKQVSNLDGGIVKLNIEELRSAYPNIRSLVGNSVYVKASVLTKSGSDLVTAEKGGIKIVATPYVISFKNTPKYFKPDLPFDLSIQVRHHDDSLAQNVQVKVNLLDKPLMVSKGTTTVTINMPNQQTPHTIIAETAQADLRLDQQARQQITVQPYMTFNQLKQNYLYISSGANRVSVGERLSMELTIKATEKSHRELIKQVTYLVVSKGQIISVDHVDVADQAVTSIHLMVTAEMMPSFRFVAFYSIPWAGLEEVVADSVWVDVVDSCVGGLTLKPLSNTVQEYAPADTIKFQIRGDPGAMVSLVAVDNSVFLLRKDRLTQTKIWDTVEHRDIGCTRGGGKDAHRVFTDAGLFFASSAGFKTQARQALQCPGSARRRRNAELIQRRAELVNYYKQKLQHRCCKDGLREIPMPYSCTRRSLYITEGWECMRAFRHCCSIYRDQVFDTAMPTTPPPTTTAAPTTSPPPLPTASIRHLGFGMALPSARFSKLQGGRHMAFSRVFTAHKPVEEPAIEEQSVHQAYFQEEEEEIEEQAEEEEDKVWQYMDEDSVTSRFKFYESWLWMDVKLPSKADADGLASKNVLNTLPDSITEWGILAISGSPNTGFCVAEPYNIRAEKNFFVDLKMPRSVARNEQVVIKAVIYNFGSTDFHVRVVLMKTIGMCSVAFKGRHTQEVKVPGNSSVVVPYTIIPLVVGMLPLDVKVLAGDELGGDHVQKSLQVVTEGVQKTKVFSVVLNPSAAGGTQTVRTGKIELDSIVPNSVPETFINVRGNLLADSINNSINEDSLASLIQMPGGCVEQNVARMSMPLIATLYLERTNDWEKVGVERRAEAIRYIKRGYENQLEYRQAEGSYPPYKGEGASTWITAYVVKVFSMAYSMIGIQNEQVCDPLLYLVKNKHRDSGIFIEENPVYSTTITGGIRGDDPQITLTAFVLIALAEAKQAMIRCTSPDVDMELVIQKTANYLMTALAMHGRRPYTVAIASYALALLGPTRPYNPTQSLLRAAAPGHTHWPDNHNTLFTLEATGYALLALVKLGHMEEAEAPFKWLNSQRKRGGGFGSTQSTMVVLQALSEYLIKRPSPEVILNVDIRITGRKENRMHFNSDSAYALRSTRLPPNTDLEVQAQGSGQGILEIVTYYNQLHEVDEKNPCRHFELDVAIEESREKPPGGVEKSYQLIIKVKALGPNNVRMVVLDINLPTGFSPENSDLELLSSSVDRYINNFQVVDNLSDRGSLIIHLFKVSNKEPEILMFRLQQNFKVGLLQPSSVTVYEYYNPDHRCSRTYTPSEDKEELSHICRDSVCRCTQDDCCVSKDDSENFFNKERETFACKSLHHVFQVKVLSLSQSYYDKYEMEILRVIKLGEEAGVEVGQRRLFISHGKCREGLILKPGSQYLIIGPSTDQWKVDSETNSFSYMLGKDTWVERWPSPAECTTDIGLKTKCKSLDDAANELVLTRCNL